MRGKSNKSLNFAILILVSLISLCIQPYEHSTPISKTEIGKTVEIHNISFDLSIDDLGSEIIPKNSQRIVSLAPSNTEILFAIELGDKVVGVTDYCDYPPEVLDRIEKGQIIRVGGYTTINIERVIALKPDLVIASYGNGLENIETLRKYTYVIAFDPKDIRGIERAILAIGKATGSYENAEKLVLDMEKIISDIKAKAEDKSRKKVVHIIWNDPIWVSGKETFIDEVISIAGGVNAFNFTGWRIVSIEDLITANPDIIIVSSGSGMGGEKDVVYEWVMSEKRLKSINAIKNGKVFVINSDLISRPGPRIVEAIERVYEFLNT